MATTLLFENQFFVTTLNVGGGITNSQTTGIIISDVTGVDTAKPGIALLGYVDPLVTSTCEWIEYTSINGSKEFVGVTRGSQGYSAKAFTNGVQVAFPHSEDHINRLATALSIGGVATNGVEGTLDEDTMSSNSATKLATQQSIKAYVDTSIAAIPSSSAAVGVRATRAASQSIATSTETAIAFTAEDFDTDAFHDNTTNNSRLTVPTGKDGKYIIVATANFAANATGRRTLILKKNGTSFAQIEWGNASTNIPYMNLTAINTLAATDYIEAFVFQTSGGNLNIDTYLSCSMLLLGT